MREQKEKHIQRSLIRKCHVCGKINESHKEQKKCSQCNKSFLPLGYFKKVHHSKDIEYNDWFLDCHEIDDADLIKGIYVIWD